MNCSDHVPLPTADGAIAAQCKETCSKISAFQDGQKGAGKEGEEGGNKFVLIVLFIKSSAL